MPFVMNSWYVVAWPHEIVADKVFARTVCNEAMVLWRNADAALSPDIQARNDHPDWTSAGGTTYMKGNYLLVNDNLLDLTHETYVHASSLGNHAVVENPIETEANGDRVTVTRWMLNHDP